MTTKLGRMATYQDAGSHNPLITELCEIGYSLTRGGSARKSLSRHRLLVVSHQEIDPNYFEHSPLYNWHIVEVNSCMTSNAFLREQTFLELAY